MPNCKVVPGNTEVVYKDKENQFYQFSVFSKELNCPLFWDAATLTFFRYGQAEDCYRPVDWAAAVAVPPRGMPDVKE